MTELITTISDRIWDPLAYFALGVGLVFTVLTKFVQFRALPDMLRQLRAGGPGEGGLSSFQTLALTLSSRMGVGSIAGVATAVAAGGPGAIMWMAITGLVGAGSAYAEGILAQVFKRRIHGEDRGGMPYYVRYGLGFTRLAMVLAVVTIIGYGFVFPGIQANNIASSAELAFNLPPWGTGLIVTSALAFVIIGGTKRIVHMAQMVVPFMGAGYILIAVVVLLLNLDAVPEAFTTVIAAGMGTDALFGGLIGYAVMWGVRRAVFASATGFGEGTFSAAAARASHPAKQAIVQAFSIYFDVLLVCMATGTLIVVTGQYNVTNPAGGYLVENVPDLVAGPNYVQAAIDTTLNGWGAPFVAFAILLFAFTSQVFFYYVATTNLMFLLNERRSPFLENILKAGALAISFFGCLVNAEAMWAAGDIGYGIIAWLNMAFLLLLIPVVRKVGRDYDRQLKAGVEPVFHPSLLGIRGADWWEQVDMERDLGVDPATAEQPVVEASTGNISLREHDQAAEERAKKRN